mgnify:FL=1
MKIFTSVSSKRLLKFTLILLLILIFSTTYIVIETNNVISEQEFEKLVKNWQILAESEFYHMVSFADGRQLGLWNLEGYRRKNDRFLDERLQFLNLNGALDFNSKATVKVSKLGTEFTFGNENVYLGFQLNSWELFPYRTYRKRVEDMLMIVEQGIDTQWSIILPELIQKTKEGDIQYITIENASYSWDTPQNMFVFSESGALENCTNGNEPILTAIPTSDLIGVTVEKVHNQLGNSSIYVARRHDFPTYVTQDAKLVLFITGDDVVERILVFDLMDDTCKLIQTIS